MARLAIHPGDQLADELTALGMSAANLARCWLNLQTLCDRTRPALT